MATLTQTYIRKRARVDIANKRDELIENLIPRRCMVVSVGLILAGLGIPMLMTLELLPVTLLLGFAGLALTATGGLLVLVNCGKI